MEFKVPVGNNNRVTYEQCPECGFKFLILDKNIILLNREIECAECNHKWRLNINPGAEKDE